MLQDVVLALQPAMPISIMERRESPQSSATVMAASSCMDETMRYVSMGEVPFIPLNQSKRSLDYTALSPQQQPGGSVVGPSAVNQQAPSSEVTNQQLVKARKLWLHTAVEPAPGGSGSQICKYCGSILSSSNISVRKKVCMAHVLHAVNCSLQCSLLILTRSLGIFENK